MAMENALWNGKLLTASEVAVNYIIEKEVRKASGNKELQCPDNGCSHPTLRYCHGDIKDAFFAHLSNETCDYAIFDKDSPQIVRTIRRVLYDHFKKQGYNVRLEAKVLDHHYTHLLFDMPDNTQIAVEIGTRNLSANKIDSLTKKYQAKSIAVKWIVVDDTNKSIKEAQTYHLKRYLLNESTRKDLIVVDSNGTGITQYKVDPNRYVYKGKLFSSENYPETYTEMASLSDLSFNENELTITGFHERFTSFISRKQKAFNKKIIMEEERIRNIDKILKSYQTANEKNRFSATINYPPQQKVSSPSISTNSEPNVIRKSNPISNKSKDIDYDKRKNEVLPQMNQQHSQVKDSFGYRWIKCKLCGGVDTVDAFYTYGGVNEINLGNCNNCRSSTIY